MVPSLTLTQPIKQMKIKVKMENGDRSDKGMVCWLFFVRNIVWQKCIHLRDHGSYRDPCDWEGVIYQQEHAMPQGETVLASLDDHTLVPSAWETWLSDGFSLTGSHLSQTQKLLRPSSLVTQFLYSWKVFFIVLIYSYAWNQNLWS